MRPSVIMVCGQDPLQGTSGHTSYVRTHARAIQRAGVEPHIFCPGAPAATEQATFGMVHRIGSSRLRRLTETKDVGLRKSFLGLDGPGLASAIAAFVRREPGLRRGPLLIHSVSTWGYGGILAVEALRRIGVEAVALNSVYTTVRNEVDAKVRGLPAGAGLRHWLRVNGECVWQRRVIARYERRAYLESRATGVNYESVRRLFVQEHGPAGAIMRLPYAPESAFTRDADAPLPAAPPELARLAPAEAPLIVSVSRHDPRKGVDVLLRALAELRGGGVPFRACITSGGELFEEHQRLAAELDLGGTTVLTGWVSDPFV